MFGNVLDKGRLLVVEGDDVRFNIDIVESIVVQELPLNEAHIILGWILYAI